MGSPTAQRRIVELIDDLDETVIEDGGTQSFALNGTAYEIDLTSTNAEKLKDALAPFIAAGRRVRQAPNQRPTPRSAGRSTEDLNAIRQWARDTGYTVSDRGRIAADIVTAYSQA
ncbi:Lsr2 family protein [Microbacterium foliorum]|uniref:histone-like nucleoid-structuring protein Lsr2 n=1 Tax=Microbacterium foliorum TaxID=104336 RepID=UPI0028D46A58|nr:Lsr2 family protein [Microbacterium foliorum]